MMRIGDISVSILRGLGVMVAVFGCIALFFLLAALTIASKAFAWGVATMLILYFAYLIGRDVYK